MEPRGQLQSAVGGLPSRSQHNAAAPSEVQFGVDDVDMICATTGHVGAQIEPLRNNLIYLNVPLKVFGYEAGFTSCSSSEVEGFYGWGVHQHVHKVMAVDHGHAVGGIQRHGARWVER